MTTIELLAGSYERVSTDEQAREGFSLEVQNERNVAHIRMQNWTYVGSYIDPGKSGKNLKRPDIQRMLTDINLGKINIVVVHKLDRLTRNIGDLHHLLMLFEQKGIKLVSITENLDTSSAMGRMFVYMLGIFAQWYRENLSEEVLKGQSKRAEKGLRLSPLSPHGYTVVEDLQLELDEREAEDVKMIFDLLINSGYGFRAIARYMNEHSNTTKKWYSNTVRYILTNPTYYGATHWTPKTTNKQQIVDEKHDPIIDKETFDLAQRIITRKADETINTSVYDFPFSTIFKCGECGRSYAGFIKDKKYSSRSYRCSAKSNAYDRCTTSRQITERGLSLLFFDFLKQFNITAPSLDKTVLVKDADKERKKLTKLIDDSLTKRKNYARAMGNGKLDYSVFEELVDEEQKKAAEWQKQLDALGVYQPSSAKTRKDVVNLMNDLQSNWETMSYAEQKIAVNNIFEVIVIKYTDDDGWRITGYKLAD